MSTTYSKRSSKADRHTWYILRPKGGEEEVCKVNMVLNVQRNHKAY